MSDDMTLAEHIKQHGPRVDRRPSSDIVVIVRVNGREPTSHATVKWSELLGPSIAFMQDDARPLSADYSLEQYYSQNEARAIAQALTNAADMQDAADIARYGRVQP